MDASAREGMDKQVSRQERGADDYGVVTGPGTVRLERLLPGPMERVWAYLTEPEKRRKWLAGGPMELRVGGKVELEFHHAELSSEKTAPEEFQKYECGIGMKGEITRCEPPRVLSYTWGEGQGSEVTFELSAEGKDVLLVITHRRLPNRSEMVGVASGWHSHVAILIDQLNGVEPRPFWTTVLTTKEEYDKRLPK